MSNEAVPVGGAIFDLDGVLVDTACHHFEAWQQMARSLGFELSLAQTRIDSCFDAIVDGNAITRTKPHPEIFLRAAAGLGLPAGACVVFEDAEAGVTAVRCAGCRVVGIGGRTFATADLTAATMSDVDLSLLFGQG